MTTDTGQFLAAAGEFLRADPARNTVMLTVTENLLVSSAAPAARPPLYGWWQAGRSPVGAAFMHTPDFPLMLSPADAPDAAPVEDRVMLSFTPAGHALRFTRERTRGLRPAGRR